jgi:hypothetical protein
MMVDVCLWDNNPSTTATAPRDNEEVKVQQTQEEQNQKVLRYQCVFHDDLLATVSLTNPHFDQPTF